MTKHPRDLLEETPVKGNGKGAEGSQESCQITCLSCSCEGEREGREVEWKSLRTVQFYESLTKLLEVLDPKSSFREVLHFPEKGLPHFWPA